MQNVQSVVDAVTVFSRGALCTRVATVHAQNGQLPSRVRLTGLPLLLKTGSLRASVRKGPAGLLVRDVRPELDVEMPAETDVPKEQRELEAAEEQLSRLEEQIQLVSGKIDALGRLEPVYPTPAKGAPPRPSSAPAILALASFVDSELAPLQARLFELQDQHKAQLQEVQLRRQRINEGSSAVRAQRTRVSRAAVVTLSEATGAEPIELSLEYVVMGARWSPAYELDLERSMNSGVLRMRANVMQRTGEDWSDVRLAFSTANLDRRADAPELKSLRIGRRQQAPQRSGWREPPPGLDELFADYDAARRHQPAPPTPPAATATRAGMVKELSLAQAALAAGRPPPAQAAMMGGPGGPPPPAPPMAAAAPMAMRSREATLAPKKAKGMAMDGASRGAPVMEEADAPMDDAFDEGGGFAEEPPAQAALEVDRSLLDYDGLELPPPDAGGRGLLRKRSGPPRHDVVMINAVSIDVNVTSIIAVLESQASQAMSLPLPRYSVVPREAAAFFDYRYDVAHRASLASDGSWHSLPVFDADVAMEAEYLAVPSVEPRAFRTVKLSNRTPHALLAGPVDVRLGGELLMTSPFPTLSPGGTQRLGLGVEESIKVSRNTRFDEATGGVFGGATVLTHGVDIEVANRLGHPIVLDVRERLPAVPQGEKDIKIEEAEVRPAWARPRELPGELPVEGERSWRVQLKGGETQKLTATFVVKIPASKMLHGGNRRV